jgi:predicted dinucleotide-binding enzyme
MTTAIIGAGNIGCAVARHLTAGGERVVLAAGDEADAAVLTGTLGGLASAAPVKEAIQAADVVLFAVTTGPRSSTTPARIRHPGSPNSIRSGVLPRLHRFKDMGMGRGLR